MMGKGVSGQSMNGGSANERGIPVRRDHGYTGMNGGVRGRGMERSGARFRENYSEIRIMGKSKSKSGGLRIGGLI